MKFSRIVLFALLAPSIAHAAEAGARANRQTRNDSAAAAAQLSASNPQTASYIAHLQSLLQLVSGCAEARNPVACDPSRVGSDDELLLSTGEHRMIRFQWLRTLLEKAQKPDPTPEKTKANQNPPDSKNTNPSNTKQNSSQADEDQPPLPGDILESLPQPVQATTTDLLKRAGERLTHDLEQARSYTAAQINPHAKEHAILKQVLSESAFRNLNTDTPKNRFLEKLSAWINSFFEKISSFGAHAPWVGEALLIGFFVLLCIVLVWSLIQSERRLRLRLTPESGFVPGPGADSARDWQLWIKDAEAAAAVGKWREAIHFIYWASISRLESSHLESLRPWPADRARTPREYLALVKIEDPRRPGLQALTRSFERTWYGGRMAGEEEYKAATKIANALMNAGGSR